MDEDEIRRRLTLVTEVTSASFDKAAQYDNAVLGLAYVGFFALWAGVAQDLPKWAALASAALIGISLMAYVAFQVFQMLARQSGNRELLECLGEDGVFDFEFATRWDAAAVRARRIAARSLRVWKPLFLTSFGTGIAGGLLLCSAATVQAVHQLSTPSSAVVAGQPK